MLAKEAGIGTIFMADDILSPEVVEDFKPNLIDSVLSDINAVGLLEQHSGNTDWRLIDTFKQDREKIQTHPEVVDAISTSFNKLHGRIESKANLLWYEASNLLDLLKITATPLQESEIRPEAHQARIEAQKKLADIALSTEQDFLTYEASHKFTTTPIAKETIAYLLDKGESAWNLAVQAVNFDPNTVKRVRRLENGFIQISIEPLYQELLQTIFEEKEGETPKEFSVRLSAAEQFSKLLENAPHGFEPQTIDLVRRYLDKTIQEACIELAPGSPLFRKFVNAYVIENKEPMPKRVISTKADVRSSDIPNAATVRNIIAMQKVLVPNDLDILGNKHAIALRSIEETLKQIDPAVKASESVIKFLGNGPENPGVLDMIRQQAKAELIEPTVQILEADRQMLADREAAKANAEKTQKEKSDAMLKADQEAQRKEALTFKKFEEVIRQFSPEQLAEVDSLIKSIRQKAE